MAGFDYTSTMLQWNGERYIKLTSTLISYKPTYIKRLDGCYSKVPDEFTQQCDICEHYYCNDCHRCDVTTFGWKVWGKTIDRNICKFCWQLLSESLFEAAGQQ
jgi:hypothetical protein